MIEEIADLRDALGDRFEIECELGRGGMAIVYLARDLKHARPVAIKVLRPELTATLAVDRFLREIEIAAKLTHPHILPLYDSGKEGNFLYYVMPYLPDENVRQVIQRAGLEDHDAPAVARAVQITCEVAEALSYAHRNKIVHRDIKPENILLEDGHAVVADFGIARAISAAGGETLTQVGGVIGTPTYMSPEQAMGLPVDGRSDIYSLGLVLYEMLIGEVPQTTAERRSILTETTASHRKRLGALPKQITHALEQALSENPDDRFATAAEFASALQPSSALWVARRRSTYAIVALVTAVVIGLGIAASVLWTRGPVVDTDRVLIAMFENHTGDATLDPLSSVASDWLSRGLQEIGEFQVVDERAVVTQAESADLPTLARSLNVARTVDAGFVVSGAYYLQGDSIRFQARVTDAGSGTVLHTLEPITGLASTPLASVEVLRERLTGTIASLADQPWPTEFFEPPRYDAYLEYVAAIPLIGRQDLTGAIAHFLRAWSLDTNFTRPLTYAAVLMAEIGQFGSADSMLHVLTRFGERIPKAEHEMVRYLEARLQGDFEEALEGIQRVAQFAPLSEATWESGQTLQRLNRPREALSVWEPLDPTRGFLQNWWFYWNATSFARHMLGEHDAELANAKRGLEQYPNLREVVGIQLRAFAARGRVDDINQLIEQAPGLRRQSAGGPLPPWYELTETAMELRAHGQREASLELLERTAIRLDERPVAEKLTQTHRTHAAIVAYLAERWAEAEDQFRALSLEFPNTVDYRGYLGTLAARRDDRVSATEMSDWLGALNHPYLYGINTLWQARIAAILGEQEQAITLLQSAFDRGLTHYGTSPFLWIPRADLAWLHRDVDFETFRLHPSFEELMRPKGE